MDALTTATESELVKRLQQGGRAAFEELLDRYERRIYNLALRLLDGHRAEAEDAAQDIFLEVHRSISRFRGDSRLDTWIHRIAVNVCLQRRRKRKLSTVELKDADGVHSPDGDPILSAQRAELRSVMESAVKSLPDGQREVVLLHGMQGLSYSEVAEVLACPVGTVKSRLSTAFRRLRETLTPYVNGDPTLGPAVVEAGK
ncbi:MAG TPA: RNA polymerase sigma factor [Gemmatimonadales bacterium]|nr:RNA polymerase sigma factor [Gemmatimonadales bacterium]